VQVADFNTDIKASTTLDAKGLNCPLPILKTKQALKGIPTGEVLRILTTDPGSKADFAAFCKQTGHQLLSSGESGGTYEFNIRKS
jgi:tRNA 2-thiouridine synthesizing protein A